MLGAAFKPDSDDIRDSPALDVAHTLHEMGAVVRVHDPKALDNARRTPARARLRRRLLDACRDADAVLHLTEWADYRALDPVALGELVAHRRLLDGRNVLDSGAFVRAGWDVRALGRPHVTG